MDHIDILIIGAGPAGISTALHLLQINPDWSKHLLIIEKAAHPRDKLCAGGLTPLGINILGKLEFPFPLPIPQVPIETVCLIYSGRTFQVKGNPRFVVFNRIEFDHYLAETARERGILIYEDETVLKINPNPDGVEVLTTRGAYLAKVVVGADGSKGIIRRTIKNLHPKKRTASQRGARSLEVVTLATQEAALFSERCAVFDFSPTNRDLQGYIWKFPAYVDGSPRFNRGIYDARTATQRPKAKLPDMLNDALLKDGANSEEISLKGHPLHWFSPVNYFSIPRILIVGDAAGTDSLFGEGIGPALGYGQIAVRELEDAFTKNDFSFRQYRKHVLISPLGWYLLWRWCAGQVIYFLSGNAWFMHLLWTIGQVWTGILQRVTR